MKTRTQKNEPTTAEPRPLRTVQYAAERFGVGVFTLSRWMNDPNPSRRLNCIRRGKGYVRFTDEHLDEFERRLDTRNKPQKKGTK